MLDQSVVSGLTHELDEGVLLADVNRIRTNMRFGVARAVPVQLVPTRSPAAPVIFGDDDHQNVGAVGAFDVFVLAPDRQLPADVRFQIQRFVIIGNGIVMQRAARTARKPGPVQKDAGTINNASLLVAVHVSTNDAFRDVTALGSCVVVLPHLGCEFLCPFLYPLAVIGIREMGAQCAAAVIRPTLNDSAAPIAVDAEPIRRQPRQITTKVLIGISWVDKFDPRTGEVQSNLRHPARVGGYLLSMRLGVLDVGSNTVHLLVVDAHHGGAPVPARSHKTELRLAEHLTPDGDIDDHAVRRLCEFVESSLEVAEDVGVTEVVAFATSAIREAGNGDQVLAEVQKRTGVQLQVLTGDEEARLTFLAVRRWFGWSSGRLLVLDIGGGSLELAVGADEEPDAAESVPLGAGRLTRDMLPNDPPTADELRAVRKMARAEIAEVAGSLTRFGDPGRAVATSKTFKQLARLTGAAPSSEGPLVDRLLNRDALAEWLPKLATMTAAERAELPGVSIGRAPQLVAGAVVAQAAMDIFELENLVICPWALREGVILRRLDGLDE